MKFTDLPAPCAFSFATHASAFAGWLQARQASGLIRRASSAQLYQVMWESFTGWCARQQPPVALASLQQAHLLAFQGSRTGVKGDALSARHALRLLRLIKEVVQHWNAAIDQPLSSAAQDAIELQPVVRYAESSQASGLPDALDAGQARQLMVFLSHARPRPGRRADALAWQLLRNRVAVALQLGAGLGPLDIRSLTLRAPVTAGSPSAAQPWKLWVPAHGSAPAHEAPLAVWAARLLAHWLDMRRAQAIAGEWLFPATRSGKPWGKMAQYNAAQQVLGDAGLQLPDGGNMRLRHTFALRQLRRGTDPQQVERWLGVSDPKVMARYARVLALQAEVV